MSMPQEPQRHVSTLPRPLPGETWAPIGKVTVLNYEVSGQWSERLVPVQDLSSAANGNAQVTILFISTAKSRDTSNAQLQQRLATDFRVPSWFWAAKAQDASGYFYANNGTSVVTVSHFLIKYIVNSDSLLPPVEPYKWHTPSFVTAWEPGKVVLLCFNFPSEAQKSFQDTLATVQAADLVSHPYSTYSIVLDQIVDLHDAAVWKFRDFVRLQEQSRPTLHHPKPDYAGLHDLARHVMHATEVSETALNVIDNMLHEMSAFDSTRTAQNTNPVNIAAEIRRHKSILQCINRRSQALEERLRNEINLAFHIASEHDSFLQAQMARAANIDSRAMKTISILGMVFLPGTFIAALFSMSFFSFTPANAADGTPASWNISDRFWIYFVITIPITALTIGAWHFWQRRLISQVASLSSNSSAAVLGGSRASSQQQQQKSLPRVRQRRKDVGRSEV